MSDALRGVIVSIVVLGALGAGWVWGIIQLFRSVDLATLPPRAQRLFGGAAVSPDAEADGTTPSAGLVAPRTAFRRTSRADHGGRTLRAV